MILSIRVAETDLFSSTIALSFHLDTNVNRMSYTERIMDILKNVERQQKDIDNILADIRSAIFFKQRSCFYMPLREAAKK